MAYNATSTPTNPLTAPLPPTPNLTPAERATERFSVTGNAIVTGGAGGLGLEAARALLEHGLKGLCLFDIASSFTASRAALQTLSDTFPEAKIIEEVVDVADEGAVQAAVERTAEALGSVDVLLCFAGIAGSAPAVDMSLELWQKVMDINLTGSWLCAKYAAKEMIKQKTGGSIVLVSSVAGYKSLFPLYAPAYSVSKSAVIGLTTNLAAEWAQHGIRVNCVCPGYMETAMTSVPRAQPGIQAYIDRTPLGRIGQPSELAGPVVMFCSPAGRYITGVSIMVNGGNHTI
ncbi:NAD(P)-binding protein [Pholiota conissans]|uniref:NAD(P)-binding protein n=1 Tax=Pholiota conissans TaxID=109636 RepID=A0A9P5YTU2_9AGAR|nr:NAD(P)-binding protein [Pholiota conissans]